MERTFCTLIYIDITKRSRYLWPRGLRRGPAVTLLLGLQVRIPPGSWMSVSSECCVLSSLCVGLITCPQESYRVCVCVCVCVCVRVRVLVCEASTMRGPCPTRDCRAVGKKRKRIHL